jgi:hypothetical protein
LYKFANKILDKLVGEENAMFVDTIAEGIEAIETLKFHNQHTDFFILLDVDGTIQASDQAYQYKFPGISFLRWRLGSPDPFPDEHIQYISRIYNISNVGLTTNRQDSITRFDIFQTNNLMMELKERLTEKGLNIPIFTNMDKQIAFMIERRYQQVIDWIKHNSSHERQVLIVSLADLDVATFTNSTFLNKIHKLALESGINASKLRIDIA